MYLVPTLHMKSLGTTSLCIQCPIGMKFCQEVALMGLTKSLTSGLLLQATGN